jgi:ABC-type sulfate transport system permease component
VKRTVFDLCLGIALTTAAASTMAYIGPGSGISLLGGLWGVLVAIVLAVGAVLIWPIRYVFRRLKRKLGGAPASEAAEPAESVEAERSTSRSE